MNTNSDTAVLLFRHPGFCGVSHYRPRGLVRPPAEEVGEVDDRDPLPQHTGIPQRPEQQVVVVATPGSYARSGCPLAWLISSNCSGEGSASDRVNASQPETTLSTADWFASSQFRFAE